MVTDDYLLDDLEKSQLDATKRRRWNRSRRYYHLLMLSLGFLALTMLAAPSIVSHTGIGQSMLASSAMAYGWKASAESIDIGWITPLTIRNLQLTGESGETKIRIQRADTTLTVTDLIGFDPSKIGEVSIRGVEFSCSVSEGYSSIELDLVKLMEPGEDESASMVHATIQIQDASATLTDSITGASWTLKQSNVNVVVDADQIQGDIAGVFNEPSGSGGALQSKFAWRPLAKSDTGQVTRVSRLETDTLWELSIDTESFPLSVTNLVARRFADQINGLPERFSGDTTGQLQLVGLVDGSIQAHLDDFQIRNLQAVASSRDLAESVAGKPVSGSAPIKQWNNELATLDGQISLSGGWLLGQGLEITTDFASATLDGSIPTTISLIGSEDNLLSWLKSLQGTARLDVDLGALVQALPGLIPLRRNATLVSGHLRGAIENTSGSTERRRSKLTLESDSLRARSDGRLVIIDPIKFGATVTDDHGSLRAERFDLSSSFARASGSGTLQDGKVEVEIDFGQLNAMLRPIIDMSDWSLGGTADGKVHWTVKSGAASGTSNGTGSGTADLWDMSGSCEAKNLLVTMPGGHRFKRSIVQGDLSAKGQWSGKALKQLTSAAIGIRSGGVSLQAELASPVTNPTADSMFPIRMETDGRLENLSESLRPWLPESLRGAEGRLTGSAVAKISRSGGSISKADFILSQPKINYENRWYVQPKLTVKFEGVADSRSGRFESQDTTVVGESISIRVQGNSSRESTNLDIAWKADLEGLQKSIGSTIARAASTKLMRPISYRPVRRNLYRVGGICEGKLKITGGPNDWNVDVAASATNFTIHSPADTRNVPPGMTAGGFGPLPRAILGQDLIQSQAQALGKPLWQEPRLKIDGSVQYNIAKGTVNLPEMQIATDWFAGTLGGKVEVDGPNVSAQFTGPVRWKMELVSARLSELLGTPVRASGVHKGAIEIGLASSATQSLSVNVKGDLGWDECEVAGIRMGATKLPFEMTSQKIKVAQTTIPILSVDPQSNESPTQAGLASFAAEVNYASGPMTIRLKSGSQVQSLRITPSTASRWLQYLTPLAAGATSIDGLVTAKFDQALIVIDDPNASVVRGNLEIQNMRLSSGPLVSQLIQGVEQVKSLARLTGGEVEASDDTSWIEMPPQTVEFSFENGVATHQRMYFQIDRASLMTSGQVTTGSQINLVAQVPLDARWLGGDLKGLAGQTLTFPITGTLSRPRVDDSAVRRVMAELGAKAGAAVIENQLEGLIQKQLGSGLDKIFPF